MKKIWVVISSLFLVVACQQGDGSGSNNVNLTPMGNSFSCINGTTYCNNTAYSQTYGWMPYPGLYTYAYNYMSYFSQNGFCSCPVGYLPIYNGTLGLGCVMSQYLEVYSGYYYFWQFSYRIGYEAPAPQTQINIPQYSNVPGAINSAANCLSTLTQGCLLNQPNSCDIGATCRQTVPGSVLGVCIRN
jgi:hypothetical protein